MTPPRAARYELGAELDRLERITMAACGRSGESPPGEPETWQWCDLGTDEVLDAEAAIAADQEFLSPVSASLRSAQEYADDSALDLGPLPHFVLPYVEEPSPQVARHITTWSPAAAMAVIGFGRWLTAAAQWASDDHHRATFDAVITELTAVLRRIR